MPDTGSNQAAQEGPCSHRACVLGWGCRQTLTGIGVDAFGGRPRLVSTAEAQEGLPVCSEEPACRVKRAGKEYKGPAGTGTSRRNEHAQGCVRRGVTRPVHPPALRKTKVPPLQQGCLTLFTSRGALSILRVPCNLLSVCLALTFKATAVLLSHVFPPGSC